MVMIRWVTSFIVELARAVFVAKGAYKIIAKCFIWVLVAAFAVIPTDELRIVIKDHAWRTTVGMSMAILLGIALLAAAAGVAYVRLRYPALRLADEFIALQPEMTGTLDMVRPFGLKIFNDGIGGVEVRVHVTELMQPNGIMVRGVALPLQVTWMASEHQTLAVSTISAKLPAIARILEIRPSDSNSWLTICGIQDSFHIGLLSRGSAYEVWIKILAEAREAPGEPKWYFVAIDQNFGFTARVGSPPDLNSQTSRFLKWKNAAARGWRRILKEAKRF